MLFFAARESKKIELGRSIYRRIRRMKYEYDVQGSTDRVVYMSPKENEGLSAYLGQTSDVPNYGRVFDFDIRVYDA